METFRIPGLLSGVTLGLVILTACANQDSVPDREAERPDYRSVEEDETEESGRDSPTYEQESSGSEHAPKRRSNRELMRKAAAYQKQLVDVIGARWNPPDFESKRLAKLASNAVVYVRLTEKGHISSYEFHNSSGSEEFDRRIETCLDQFTEEGGKTVPMPDDRQLRKEILRRGFFLRQWHYGSE